MLVMVRRCHGLRRCLSMEGTNCDVHVLAELAQALELGYTRCDRV